jgi:high-affinity nickel-transport protein
VSTKFGAFSKVGGIIGSSVSAAFLILLGLMNVYILYKLVEQMRILIKMEEGDEQRFRIKGAGCLFWVLKRLF